MSSKIVGLSHQDILLEEGESKGKIQLVRQERFGLADWKSFLLINDKHFEVLNYSTFGIALLTPHKIFHDNDNRTFWGILEIQNIQVQKLELRVVYQQPIGYLQVKTALEVIGKPIDIDQISAALEGLSLVKNFIDQQEATARISPNFKQVVFEVQDIFFELRQSLKEIEKQWHFASPSVKKMREKGIGMVVVQYLDSTLGKYFTSVEKQMVELKDNEKMAYLNFFRHKLSEFLWDAPMAHRAYYKPQGYAGDYEMMNLIYRDEYEGQDLFAKCLHKFYVNQAAARSVKNRVPFLIDKILNKIKTGHLERPVKILSVASGPAYEIQKLLEHYENNLPRLHITLFDQDLKALQHAQHKVKEIILQRGITNVEIHYQHSAVKNLIVTGVPNKEQFDFIYSAGLFDYFSDAVFIACAKQLYSALASNGTLLIGNFDVNNPTRGVMEVVLDWNLIYRSRDEIKQLATTICPNFSIEAETEGINLFVELKKNITVA